MSHPIPLVDLAPQHAEVAEAIAAGWSRQVAGMSFILGDSVQEFETLFAQVQQVAHCVGVANGTDGIELALRALDIGAGDEVIVPANSFIASALAVLRAGATPVLVDCDPLHYLMDARSVADKLTPRTRAILPVHLFGQMAAMEELENLAPEISIVEDAAQAQGATRNGCAAGAWGTIGATSFYPGKNLGAYGDAGAVLTGSETLAARVRALRNYGSERKYHHPQIGFNSRLDPLQAVVLTAKLPRLLQWNAWRRLAAERYDEMLAPLLEVQRPGTLSGNTHVWHLYVVQVPDRERVCAELDAAGIGFGIHYPVPTHLQGALAFLGHRLGDFPVTESAALKMLSLPMYPHLSVSDQERVVACLARALRRVR